MITVLLAAVFIFTPSPDPAALNVCRAWAYSWEAYLPQEFDRNCRDTLTPDGTCWAVVGPKQIPCSVYCPLGEGYCIAEWGDPGGLVLMTTAKVYAVWPSPRNLRVVP